MSKAIAAAAVLVTVVAGCAMLRSPDEVRVDVGRGTSTIDSNRTRSLETSSETVTGGVSWDIGERRQRRSETLAALDALSHRQQPREPEREPEPVPEPPPDEPMVSGQEVAIGGSALLLALVAWFKDWIWLKLTRRGGSRP